MGAGKTAIRCGACGKESWLVRKAQYDEGFRKIGERLSCALCGHVFAGEDEVDFLGDGRPKVFSADELPHPAKVFEEGENAQMCRYCAEYVVNPFWQRCGLHRREVEATDTCGRFRPRETPPRE